MTKLEVIKLRLNSWNLNKINFKSKNAKYLSLSLPILIYKD